MKNSPRSSVVLSRSGGAFQIALLYLTIGVLWILFSDEAAARLAPNQAVLTQISIYKGWGYVLVTALLLYGMIRLLTRRISQAEWTLSASEKNYEELLQQASDGIFIADAKGNYTLVNEEACRLMGYTKAELLSMNLRELIAPEDVQNTPPRLDELHNGKTLLTERKLLRKDGSRILCEISAKMLPDGRYQSIIRDITERKVTEAALRRSEMRYRSLFENMTNGFSRCQMLYEKGIPTDFVYLDINDAFKKLTGLQDVIGKRVSAVIPGIRESNPELFEIYGRVALTGKPEKFETHVPGLGSGAWFSVSVYSTEKDFFVAVFETITERKQAEAKLHDSEEQYRLMFTNNPLPMWVFDRETFAFLAVNDATVAHYGYSREEFLQMTIKDIRPSEDIPVMQKIVATKSEPYFNVGIVRHRKEDGTLIDVEITRHEILFDGHEALIILANDVTERKRAEAIKTQLAAIVDSSEDAIIGKTLEGVITSWNSGAKRLYGYSAAEVIGQPISVLIPSDRQDELPEILTQLKRGESIKHFETQRQRKDGTRLFVSLTISPVKNALGQVTGASTIARDITDRKQAEKAIRESQELFLKAFRANPAAMIITRLADGTIIDLNASYEQIFEYTRDELIGKTSVQVNIIVHPEERKTIVGKLQADGHVYGYETTLRAKSGKLINALFSIEMIEHAGEQCMLSIIYDFTERKHVEEELRRSNAELEQFAYVASHDLQEPLRAVAGMVQLLQQRYQGKLDERADEYISHAVEASTRMQNLINDLLEYSRVARFGKPLAETNLESCLKNALANLQVSIQESHAQITHTPLPVVKADAIQLTQVLQNLIGNAIKFRGARPLHIHIDAKQIGNGWQFEVSDNGIGIEPQYFERIFQVFQRLHTRREYPGTGIGLALCKKIIERHNGQIWVESQPGLGSTFYFTIPERQP